MLISANAINEKQIKYLKSLPKEIRNIKIGLMIQKDKEYGRIIKNNLVSYRTKFIKANDIEPNNIISVKKDAFFLVNCDIEEKIFNNVEFRIKNKYSSYYNISDHNKSSIQFFYSKKFNKIDIKGISIDEEVHDKYMLSFLKTLFAYNEVNRELACEYLKKFAYKYRNRKLNPNYYIEFNNKSKFKLNMELGNIKLYTDDLITKDSINIEYNYINIIVPFIKLLF